MNRIYVTFLIILMLVGISVAQKRDFTRWVNPFIGTGGHGHTFPGATMPFGMVQLSPDTRIDNWDGSSGYHYSDDIIYGFSHTHLSGTGIPDGCDILFMPTVGVQQLFAKEGDKSVNGYASKFSHANEKAEPGYYSVKLDDDGILAEMTATTRVGFHRYTFPKAKNANIILDLNWRDKLLGSQITRMSDQRIEGYRESSSWSKKQKVYFVAEFSKKFDTAAFSTAPSAFVVVHRSDRIVKDERLGNLDQKPLPKNLNGKTISFSFKTDQDEKILIKVAISYVSIEGARKNLEAELPGWDFDKVRADAKAAWYKELSKIEVSGGTADQTTNFYTALYHTMIQPNIFNDVDGRYGGHDGKVHQLSDYSATPPYLRRSSASPNSSVDERGGSAAAPNRRQSRTSVSQPQRKSKAFPQIDGQNPPEQYTVFSLWDTFRAAHPLYTIIDQKRTVDFINTFIRMYEQGGRLPVWELWGEETDTMIGYHAVSVIADAMAKGIKGFDYEKAYAASKHSAELDHFGLAAYKRRGYISMEDENESVSRTLEYAYNDWCITMMSWELEDKRKTWSNSRGAYFENLFDPETGFFRPKKNGDFVKPFAPNEVTFGFTEGNSWQYSFFVPHDVPRLMELMGGREKFAAKLDELFTTDQKLAGREQADLTGLIGQYAHGNEPSHHIAYLYNYADQPWKTQKYVRRIMDEFYKPTPDGLIGNEDCGQMSAWYVLSAMGFYQVAPGVGIYDVGTPLFKQATIHLENGKRFVIKAPAVSSTNIYVQSVSIDGRHLGESNFGHFQIENFGTLEFVMGPKPSPNAFSRRRPYDGYDFVTVPVIIGERSFNDSTEVSLKMTVRPGTIYYTIDGSEPTARSTLYVRPFRINSSTTVKAFAINEKGTESFVETAKFNKRPHDWTAKVISGYSRQYTGGGENAIIDGIRGTTNFASGEWQGIQGKPYEAVVDLKRMTDVREVGASFLQVAGPWIWMPDRVEFEVSSDGVSFTRIAEIKPAFPVREMTPTIKEYRQSITPTHARYVRIRAFNFGKIPALHPGAGGDPWIFVDEIIIR